MKKNRRIVILIAVLIMVILVIPVPKGVYKDGGTREYAALTYKIVDWNRLFESGIYEKTQIYLLPDNFKSIDALWEEEREDLGEKIVAEVFLFTDTEVILHSLEDDTGYRVSREELGYNELELGDILEVRYSGAQLYSDPPVITDVISCKKANDYRPMEYTDVWIDKNTAEKNEEMVLNHITITEIYANCFFARSVIPMPYEIKLNGKLSDDWCVGDQVSCTYENTWYDDKNQRVEADMLTIEMSNWTPDAAVAYKPVIYLYPEEQTEVSVELELNGDLVCTYPDYGEGWKVTAYPDGTLADDRGISYNYLYWEGKLDAAWEQSQGFCIKGSDTAAFLEGALEQLGLSRREANEFIVFWLPMMQDNPYNVISFQQEAYTDAAKLEVTPEPDTVIRVFMTWQPSDYYLDLESPVLKAPERNGFTVVEWGGTKTE